LRQAFGDRLRVSNELAAWYRQAAATRAEHAATAIAEDARLANVPTRFATWLRPYQRVGARWIAQGYRSGGLVADMPGLGKTPETLAALLEAQVQGPVLIVCPKASVRSVWGYEARRHLKGVPVYLCWGDRAKRTRKLTLFAKHMTKDPQRLRVVVVVAEMLRVKLGNPCYTYRLKEEWETKDAVPGTWSEDGGTFTPDASAITVGNKISGMCKQRLKSIDGNCRLHISDPQLIAQAIYGEDGSEVVALQAEKLASDKVPVDFEYPWLFDRMLLGGGWSWVILDEAHRLLGSLTISKGNLMGRALKLIPERTGRQRRALTGTPFGKGGRVQGIFGTLYWLWPDEYTSFWKWAHQVLEVSEKVINRHGKTVPEILGPKGGPFHTEAAEAEAWEGFLRSLGPRVLRRTKAEMLKDLPPKTYVEVVCDLDPKQRKQLREMADYAEITTPGGRVTVNGVLALRTRAQQLANGALTMNGDKVGFTQESGKLDALWERLDERGILDGAPGPKLVIASRYNEFLDAIATMLHKDKVNYLRLDGSVSEPMREGLMKRWQEGLGDERVMLVNVKAGGVSINLDAADEMHMMDEDPDPGVNEQMEDRIHRASRMHKVVIYYYRTKGTVDYEAAHSVEVRRQLQHAVLDGRRGVEDGKSVQSEQSLADMIANALEGEE
jgi:SNF2 family DNA or RNA helicase